MNIFHRYPRHIIVISVLAACLAVGYSHVFFLGKSLIPSLFYPGRAIGIDALRDTARPTVNTFDVDLATPAFLEFPVNPLIGSMIKAGRLPLWDPYQGCGVPLNAQYSTSAFFPYQVLMNLASWRSWDHFMLLRLLCAGFFTYLFLTALGLSTAAAAAGGMMFMLSGSMVWFINLQQYINVAMVFPAMMFCVERMISRTQGTGWLAWSAITVGLVLLGGQPESAAYMLLFAAAYVAFRIISSRMDEPLVRPAAGLRFIVCCVIGFALAACVILPFLEYTAYAFYCHPPGGRMGVVTPAPWNLFVCILMPHLTEVKTFLRYFPHNGVWDYLGGYTGAGVIFLAIAGLVCSGKLKKTAYFFCIAAAVILAKNAGMAVVSWIGRLPLLDQVWSNRWAGPVWVFACCCAAAIGCEQLAAANSRRRRRTCIICAGLLIGIALLYAYHVLFVCRGRITDFLSVVPDELLKLGPASYLVSDPHAPYMQAAGVFVVMLLAVAYIVAFSRSRRHLIAGVFILVVSELLFCIPKAMDGVWTGFKVIPFGLGALAALLTARGRTMPACAMACISWAALVWIDAASPAGFPKLVDPYPDTAAIRFLRAHTVRHERIMAGDGILMPNFSGAYGLEDIRYAVSMSPKEFQEYVNRHLLSDAHTAPTQQLWFSGRPDDFKVRPPNVLDEVNAHGRYYDFLGLKYLILSNTTTAVWPLVYDDEVRIYENPRCLPRVFIVHAVDHASSASDAQDRMGQDGFDPRARAIVEDTGISLPAAPEEGVVSRAVISEYLPDMVRIDTDSSSPGILVLTDVFYPGWTACIDGRPAKIFRVNGVVRGVMIQSGSHSVVFRYAPRSFFAGAALGLAGLCACVGLLAWRRRGA